MSQQITTAFVAQYRANVEMLIQQKQSKFEGLVRRETQRGEYEYFEQIGPVSAAPWGPRHGDTPLMETPHERRRNTTSPFVWADLIDKPDRVRTLIDPTSPYAANAVMAFNRRKDDVIIKAAIGTAYTGYEGETPVALPPANNINGTAGRLTLDLLKQTKLAFWNDDIDQEEQLIIACTPNQIDALLDDDKVTSSDYAAVKALVQGDINSFYGFYFIRSTRLPYIDNGDGTYKATAIAWCPSGILLGVGEDITVRVDERADKKYSTQVFVSMDIGATRMEEKKVRTITTKDTTKANPAP